MNQKLRDFVERSLLVGCPTGCDDFSCPINPTFDPALNTSEHVVDMARRAELHEGFAAGTVLSALIQSRMERDAISENEAAEQLG
jgi:hypothetical protein